MQKIKSMCHNLYAGKINNTIIQVFRGSCTLKQSVILLHSPGNNKLTQPLLGPLPALCILQLQCSHMTSRGPQPHIMVWSRWSQRHFICREYYHNQLHSFQSRCVPTLKTSLDQTSVVRMPSSSRVKGKLL